AGKPRDAAVEDDLVLLEQIKNAFVVLADDLALARLHLLQIEAQALDFYPMLGKRVPGMFVVFRRLQQGFGRNAADVGARASRRRLPVSCLPVVDAGRPEPELCRANGGHIAAGAGADDDHIECFRHCWRLKPNQRSSSMRAGSSSASLIATSDSTASRPSMMRWSY